MAVFFFCFRAAPLFIFFLALAVGGGEEGVRQPSISTDNSGFNGQSALEKKLFIFQEIFISPFRSF